MFRPVEKRRPRVRPKGKEGVVHRAETRRATPAWADLRAIGLVYKEARRRTRETGTLYVVDHIVPKISDRVCGLHVPWNLRVVPWRENTLKHNRWWPDMPESTGDLFEDKP